MLYFNQKLQKLFLSFAQKYIISKNLPKLNFTSQKRIKKIIKKFPNQKQKGK